MTISSKLTKSKTDNKAAISRRLSPLEKTATVAGFRSTYEQGMKPRPEDLYEEMLSAEAEKHL